MSFYEILSGLMKTNQLTAKQLSETLKIGKNQFKYWKDKGNIPNGDTLIALADYFNCSVDYLLGRAEQQNDIDVKDKNSKRLLYNYEKLNDTGKEKLLDYSDDLINSGNYADTVIIAEAARTSDNRKSLTTRTATREELEIFETVPQSDEEL